MLEVYLKCYWSISFCVFYKKNRILPKKHNEFQNFISKKIYCSIILLFYNCNDLLAI